MPPQWKTIWQFLKILNSVLNLEYLHPAVPFLGVYLREMKIYVQAKTYIQIFICNISIHNSQRNRNNCSIYHLMSGKTKCGVYIHKGGYSAIKRNEILIHAYNIDKPSNIMLSERIQDRKGHIL